MSVAYKDTGLKNLLKEFSSNTFIKVGLLAGAESEELEKGLDHELGSPERNLPQRSFIRMPLQQKKRDLIKNMPEIKKAEDIKKIFIAIGVNAVTIIQNAFETGGFGQWQKLSPVTIEKKGFDTILIETGRMRKSVSFEVVKNG